MPYRTVFDLADQPPFEPIAAWIAAGFIAGGIAWRMVQRTKYRKRLEPPSRKGLTTPKVLIGFGIVVAAVGVGLLSWDHWRLMRDLAKGDGRVVEGVIQSWGTERVRTSRRDRYEYHTYERFYVGDSIWFGFYREVGMAGFHNGARELIDLHDGMRVRATYLYADGMDDPPRIMKLEIAE